jgi:hypothetical protein
VTTTPNTPKSFKVGVKTPGDRNWGYNALRFPTAEQAEAYGHDLAMRWLAVTDYEVHPSDDEPRDTWPREVSK